MIWMKFPDAKEVRGTETEPQHIDKEIGGEER